MSKLGISKQQAAIQAGFTRGGSEADRLLKNSEIVNRIEARKLQAAEYAKVTPEQILGATAMRAFASIDDALDDYGNFDIKKARKTGAIHLVKKIERTQFGFKAEFYSNETAQERLGNYLGLDKAPADVNDVTSLRMALEEVAYSLAAGGVVTPEHRKEAWDYITKWATEKRARYSQQALQEVAKEFSA